VMNAEGAKLSGKRTAKVKKSLEISLSWRETEGLNLSGKRTGAGMPLYFIGWNSKNVAVRFIAQRVG